MTEVSLTEELLAEANYLGEDLVRTRSLGISLTGASPAGARRVLTGLATLIAAKITRYTYAFYLNRMLERSQGKIKELWA